VFSLELAPGLEIRQFEMRDAETAFAAIERNRAHLRAWLPWVDSTRSLDDVRAFILKTRDQAERGLGPQAAIWLGGSFAGSIGCHPFDWSNRSAALGYWLDADLQGQGIITRCARAMVDCLFTGPQLHRVEIRCGLENTRSCAIPMRLGFQKEGVARHAQWVNGRWVDLVIWSMLATEWK
jgi:ribosomal-protein-serine acetyltransferase